MKINFNLVYPSRQESPIRLIVTHRGKVYRKSVGLTVRTAMWGKKRCADAKVANALRLIRVGLEYVLDDLSSDGDIQRALARVHDGKWDEKPTAVVSSGKPTFWQYFATWKDRDTPAKRQRANTYKLVSELMGTADNWGDIDSAYYFRLIQAMNARQYSKNYQGSVVAKVKTVMSEGRKLKYHDNDDFRDFKKPSNEVDSVYLTQDELDAVWNLELTDDLEKKARDMLIVGCYTGARWEDYSRFSAENIQGREFKYIQKKTGARVTLPISPRLRAVLKRNGGHAPTIGDVVFNRIVKVVCMRAGITTPIQVRESKGDTFEHKVVPKYKMVSSHTCRRTMCTLLDKAGVPHKEIMVVSGHKSLASFERYLRQTSQDVDESLAKVKFFK